MSTPLPNTQSPAPTQAAPTTWTREYHRKISSFAPFFVAGVLGFMGLIFLIFAWLLGLLLIAAAIGIPFLIRYLSTSIDIISGPEGFTFHSKSKRTGDQKAQYRWDEVTATKYEEYQNRSSEGAGRTLKYFIVETTRGQAFKVDEQTRPFPDLISVFNFMTPHLPYTWEPQAGAHGGIGILSAARQDYHQVPRQAAPTPTAAP